MSSTGRGGTRHPQDFYGTPIWTTHRLLDRWWPFWNIPLRGTFRVCDPCAGDGAIFRAIFSHPKWEQTPASTKRRIVFHANELRPACIPVLERMMKRAGVRHEVNQGDFLRGKADERANYDLILTNPPFSKALEFRARALELAPEGCFLLRLNFLSSQLRHELFQTSMPRETWILPNRPCFACSTKSGKPGSDATEYAWMMWNESQCKVGAISVLDVTPKAVISAARAKLVTDAKAARRRRA